MDGKLLLREGIQKTVPQSPDAEIVTNMFRLKYPNIYLDASLVSDADKLQLLKSHTNKIIDIAGKEMISLRDYKIIENDYSVGKYVIKDLTKNIKINVYKMEF